MTTNEEAPKPKRLRITGYSNDMDCSEFTFATFEDRKGPFNDRESALSQAVTWLDNLLDGTSGFCLLSRMNKLRCECNLGKDPPPFPDSFSVPMALVNLLIKEFGLQIEED